ncbi:hypothetical protein KKG45_00160 [bacterium]|nr:hypothetical protein [bacterium]MBU1071636.1 hypothetical protein [bacterium]MBU1675074.1 hypothetical protein [bacterium]
MTPLYQSRQVAWWVIGMIVVMTVFFTFIATNRTAEAPIWVYPAILLVMLPLCFMTVTVTREHLRIACLLGVPRKTVRIGDIRSCEPYRAKGIQRFAAQIKPFQGRFQMTGAGGVVINRNRGIPIMVSDPEPDELARAVARAREKHDRPGRA